MKDTAMSCQCTDFKITKVAAITNLLLNGDTYIFWYSNGRCSGPIVRAEMLELTLDQYWEASSLAYIHDDETETDIWFEMFRQARAFLIGAFSYKGVFRFY